MPQSISTKLCGGRLAKRTAQALTWAVALVGALILTGCSTNPATGKTQLNVLGAEQEVAIGTQATPEFIRDYGGEVPSESIRRYVADLGHRLAAVSERPGLPWEFHVLDSKDVNAFALPGGKVFITRQLLSLLDNEAQLAGVLGHEIGHVTAQHAGQKMTQALLIQGAAIGFGVAGDYQDEDWLRVLGVGTQIGGTVYLLKFSRDQEDQADKLGVRYMARLGYNPVGQLQVMQVLEREAATKPHPPQFLSTHPLPKDRIKKLDQLIRERYPDYQDPSRYRFNFDAYKAAVIEPLKTLPPPKHPKK
jgi:predicted Zn-dependent protease